MGKITMDALDRHVLLGSHIVIQWNGSKYKAYCKETGTYVQFPTAIRKQGKTFTADVVKAKKESGTIFYRAYRGSIVDDETGKVVG
jgi:hypothetical protein